MAVTKNEFASIIKTLAADGGFSAQDRAAAHMIWSAWDAASDSEFEETVGDAEAEYILDQFPLGPDEELTIGEG